MSMITYLLIIIIVILAGIIILAYKKLRYICNVLDDVLNGNLNQRVRFQNQMKIFTVLSTKINKLIQNFQEVNRKNIVNEESRKKMISNISHDLRTPLTSMLGYMELIFEDKELKQDKKEEYLKIIYNKGNSLYSLMEEFFQISKLDSNDVKLEIKKINLSEIIRQSIILFFVQIQKQNIEPKINIGDKDLYVYSDEKVISRIMNNLINNALKHGAKATKIGVDLNCDEKNIFIDVWDNGIGIPEDEINCVFDRLYMVEKSRSTNLKSSGLGLTIVKNLVELLEGKISVSSIPLERTMFKITLPIKLRNM